MNAALSFRKVVVFPFRVYETFVRVGFGIVRGSVRFLVAMITGGMILAVVCGVGYVALYPLFN